MLEDSELKEMKTSMKTNDKARAFDLIIDAYKNRSRDEDLSAKVENILSWCSSWFGK